MNQCSQSPDAEKFFREIDIASLATTDKTWMLSAGKSQLREIADRLRVLEAKEAIGKITLKRAKTDVLAHGHIKSVLIRECSHSLEPVVEKIDEDFSFRLTPDFSEDDIASDEDVDLLDGQTIALGDLVVQQIALAMAPYPRNVNATSLIDELDQEKPENPFSGLQSLLDKNE